MLCVVDDDVTAWTDAKDGGVKILATSCWVADDDEFMSPQLGGSGGNRRDEQGAQPRLTSSRRRHMPGAESAAG